jgi:hypothetical protein
MIRAAALLLVLIPPIAAYFLGYDFARAEYRRARPSRRAVGGAS